ncbi:hypothetical protein EIN_403150 [Entamoeba invadens IP1]|uniref:Uncharacterized protein n=1 Tax=Entamoeba invadens IP1 TaxID=370355 RepID=A0A0A1UA24_ENTIV|nr:hypothetical protein EIN_403150 [Entamoeba invadens IP1]ELP90001.1 hypothetical protein EIN_403150 [Entamoeba invadens IP1]|eukprot:XP_004256772.1 hypothetical protein EIN_403150 [Entamoeba invadens IP1]
MQPFSIKRNCNISEYTEPMSQNDTDSVAQNSKSDLVQCTCSLCQSQDTFLMDDPKVKTTRLCVLILKSLKDLKPSVEYFSLRADINVFIEDHWKLLSKLKLFKSPNYRKALLDAFNHCNLIESGKSTVHNRGFYKLRETKAKKTLPKKKPTKKETQKVTRPENIAYQITQDINALLEQLSYTNTLLVQTQSFYVGNPINNIPTAIAFESNVSHINTLSQVSVLTL